MRNVICSLILSYSFLIYSPVEAQEVSCECPTLACDSCSANKGITFYTEKCGPRASKVKSCGRPTCIPIDSATKECPNPPRADSGPREPIVVAEAPKANAADDRSAAKVGRVKVIKGSVNIVNADGKSVPMGKEGDIRESDTIVAGNDGTAVVEFDGGNKMHVHSDTEVKVQEYKNQDDAKARKALLKLIKGKIRSQVEQKYNGKTSFFKIETKGAVAGVRGTDFVISHSLGDQLETRVEAIEGKVAFGGRTNKDIHELTRGEGATFVTAKPSGKKELDEFVEGGTLSPVYKIPADKLRDLEFDSRVDVARAKKKNTSESEICNHPRGYFNQCAWTKVGGDCIRRRCNGNGQWAEETKLPAAAAVVCPAGTGIAVKDCDY
jgi:hypothetical protein